MVEYFETLHVSDNNEIDIVKKKKAMWKGWVNGYIAEVNDTIKNNPRGNTFGCPDCEKNIAKKSYLRHRTVDGCSKLNSLLKFYNWTD